MSRNTKRFCWYRDCDTDSQSHPERTLFQFPKDEARAQRWSELGAVDPIAPSTQRFLCDLHFSRIYQCFSARRRMLLNTAVPYQYGAEVDDSEQVQSSNEVTAEEHLEENDYEMLANEDPGNENEVHEILFVEDEISHQEPEQTQSPASKLQPTVVATPKSSEKARIIKVEKLPTMVTSSSGAADGSSSNQIVLRKVKIKKRPGTVAIKAIDNIPATAPKVMKLETTEATVSSSPKKKLECEKPVKTSSPVTNNTKDKPSPFKLDKKNDQISEFIFKGEEYVQMPKRLYIEGMQELKQQAGQIDAEKAKIMKQLDYYKNIVRDMREIVGQVDEDDDF